MIVVRISTTVMIDPTFHPLLPVSDSSGFIDMNEENSDHKPMIKSNIEDILTLLLRLPPSKKIPAAARSAAVRTAGTAAYKKTLAFSSISPK